MQVTAKMLEDATHALLANITVADVYSIQEGSDLGQGFENEG